MENSFKLLAVMQRQAGNERKAQLYEFLGTCSQEDLCTLFDSSAFNDIAQCYVKVAAAELEKEGELSKEQEEAIRGRHRLLFDEMTAAQAIR